MKLNPLQNDRAAGVIVAMAAGDALGAGYEFGAPLPDGTEVTMKGGGPFGFAPSEWTDDTSMAIPIAQALLECSSSRPGFEVALTMIVRAWTGWAAEAKDVGAQTRAVISAARRLALAAGRDVTAADFTVAAAEFHARTGRSGGNGSLMRTAPLALAFLDKDPSELMAQAGVLSALTHADPDAQEACALWCVAIRKAVLTGELDARAGLPLLPSDRAAMWLQRSRRRSGPGLGTSRTTAGLSKRCRALGAPSTPPALLVPGRRTSAPRMRRRSAADATRTPSQQSRVGCLGPPTATRRCRSNGDGDCTAGPE